VVSVEEEAQHGNVIKFHFSIADTGIGIAKDRQAAIFESFTQADGSTTRKYGGTGLGTTISKQLVEMMGGNIWLASPTNSNKDVGGHGSTFHFTAEFKIPTRQKTTYWFKDVDLYNVRVLVVDDNRTSRGLTAFVMENWGMSVETVDGGPAALKAYRQAIEDNRPYHLIVLDSHMPGMDGFTVAAELQKIGIPDDTEIIMLTAAGVKGDAQRCRDLGISTYIHKPLKQTVLYRSVQATLNLNQEIRGENRRKDEQRRRDHLITEHSLIEAGRRLKILVAEDNKVNQVMIKKLLIKHGHDVTLVDDGPSAILHQEKSQFDLILMDIQMPLMDGDKATRIIRDKEEISGGHIPIIALTAHAMVGDREKYIESGMDGYVSKPIDAAELFKTMKEIYEKFSPDGRDELVEEMPNRMVHEIEDGNREGRIFDKQAALERFDGDEDLLNEITAVFLDDYAKQLDEIADAVDKGDAELIDRTAHRLKGAVGNIGAQAVVDLALELEKMGRKGELDGIEDKYRQLKNKVNQLVQELRQNKTITV
jgi:CheY-like chemotaxis protein